MSLREYAITETGVEPSMEDLRRMSEELRTATTLDDILTIMVGAYKLGWSRTQLEE